MTSPRLPPCFIGPGKSLQRCPKQMLERAVWVHGGGGDASSIPLGLLI